jgi:hypothetical protein
MKLRRRVSWVDFRPARAQLSGFLIHNEVRTNHPMAEI